MREYKFRGKRMDNGELVFGFGAFIWEDDGVKRAEIYSTYGIFEVDPESVGQYIGLPDRNDKEIYENATVLITGTQELGGGLTFEWNEKAIVKWSDEECGFYLDAINKREVGLCQDGYFTVDTFPLRKWEEGEWDIEYEVLEGEI
jgi:hypothetical protein